MDMKPREEPEGKLRRPAKTNRANTTLPFLAVLDFYGYPGVFQALPWAPCQSPLCFSGTPVTLAFLLALVRALCQSITLL